MDFESYRKAFTEKAIQSGFSEFNINKCLNYAQTLFSNNVPVIYNTSHFSSLVGYKKNYIKRAALRTDYFYREFEIKKKNGKKRKISEPLPSLKDIQLWILKNILYKVEVSKFAKAYVPKVNLKNNITYHKKQKIVFTVDIKDFFPSITQKNVESVFLSLGYSKIISNLLSKLCCLKESLPQGAPTSPYLSNIFMKDFDVSISSYCVKNKIRYTRYADDLTFSGDFNYSLLLRLIKVQAFYKGLVINEEKTKLMGQNERQIITGVVVNEKLQISKTKRDEIRQAMYYIKKFGLKNHMDKVQLKRSYYREHLLGKINFILFLNPEDKEFLEYKKQLKQLL